MKDLLKQFKEFAVKGNMIDMAVGIIIGAAFTSVVNSIVKDIIMPPLSLILTKVNFSNLFVVLHEGKNIPAPYPSVDAATQAGAVILNIGAFLNNLISFLIVAATVFMLVKSINKLKSRPQPIEPNAKDCPFCKSSINIAATRCPNCTSNL